MRPSSADEAARGVSRDRVRQEQGVCYENPWLALDVPEAAGMSLIAGWSMSPEPFEVRWPCSQRRWRVSTSGPANRPNPGKQTKRSHPPGRKRSPTILNLVRMRTFSDTSLHRKCSLTPYNVPLRGADPNPGEAHGQSTLACVHPSRSPVDTVSGSPVVDRPGSHRHCL